MYKITEKVALNPTVTKMVIEAPLIAKKAKPGQFIIVRPFEDSERIPLTVAGYDREKGTVDIIFQIVGGTTMELNSLNAGDSVHDFVGPLGRATETEGLKKVCVVGGGVGCAIALPIAKGAVQWRSLRRRPQRTPSSDPRSRWRDPAGLQNRGHNRLRSGCSAPWWYRPRSGR